MKIHQFRLLQQLPTTMETAWDFFSDPANLGKITPPEYAFRSHPFERPVFAGQLMQHSIRVFPLCRITWLTEITHVVPGRMFIDQQRFGPYRFWHHRHVFTPCAEGVEMLDEVHYAVPFGPAGRVANALLVRPKLIRLFAYRRQVLEQLFRAV